MDPKQHAARLVALLACLPDDGDSRTIPALCAYAILRYATLNAARLVGLADYDLRQIATTFVDSLSADAPGGDA